MIEKSPRRENLRIYYQTLHSWNTELRVSMQHWRSYDENIIISGNCRETPHSALLEDELQEIDAVVAHLDISIE